MSEDRGHLLIEEVPELSVPGPERRTAWWRLGLALLVAAALLLALRPAAEPLDADLERVVKAYVANGTGLEVWDDHIARAFQHAEGLQPEKPLRSLRELFYNQISEASGDYPYIRTECVIDVVQATAYLMEAVVNLYRAIDQKGQRCADSDVGCAVNVIGFITCITWVAAYLSLASSACAQAVNSRALCAADWATVTAAFGEIATAGAAVRTDCSIPNKQLAALGFPGWVSGFTTTPRPAWEQFVPLGEATKVATTIVKIDRLKEDHRYRGFSITQCVADVFQAASFLIRALLQIRNAAQSCPNPRNCAIDIMNVISSFAWISHFSVQAVDNCAETGSTEARCGADISALVAAIAMTPAAGYATTSDCAADPAPMDELGHEPTP